MWSVTRWRSGATRCPRGCTCGRDRTGRWTRPGQDSFEAYFEDAGIDPADVDPIPIGVFLDHTDWFARRKGLDVDRRTVSTLSANGSFVAAMDDGTTITADKVLAAPGIKHFTQLPSWYDDVPAHRRGHTSELVALRRPGRPARRDHRGPAERL